MSDKEQNKTSSPKKKVAIGIIAGVLAVSVITVFAAIVVQTLAVKNYFKSADSTPPRVVEEFTGTVKSDIKIQNDADYDVYVRAKLVFTLKDDGGNILGYVPIEKPNELEVANDSYEYTCVYGQNTFLEFNDYKNINDMKDKRDKWIYNEVDGFYYYSSPVSGTIGANGRQTEVLVKSITVNEESKVLEENEGYSLHVEVLSQFVQVAGRTDVYTKNPDGTDGKYDPVVDGIPPIQDAWGAKIKTDNKEALDYLCIEELPARPATEP